jgi:hypothetical protein
MISKDDRNTTKNYYKYLKKKRIMKLNLTEVVLLNNNYDIDQCISYIKFI